MAKDYKELYEERAAIIEFDGGKSRKVAEEDALVFVTNLFIKDENLDMKNAASYAKIRQFKRDLVK